MSIPMRSVLKIYSLKEILVTQAEWELADAVRNERSAETALQQMEWELQQSADCLKERQQSGVSAQELLEWTEWMETQRQQIRTQNSHFQHLSQVSARCKDNLVEKHREKETWNRLKRQQLQALEQDIRKKEQSELDEIASRRHTGETL